MRFRLFIVSAPVRGLPDWGNFLSWVENVFLSLLSQINFLSFAKKVSQTAIFIESYRKINLSLFIIFPWFGSRTSVSSSSPWLYLCPWNFMTFSFYLFYNFSENFIKKSVLCIEMEAEFSAPFPIHLYKKRGLKVKYI